MIFANFARLEVNELNERFGTIQQAFLAMDLDRDGVITVEDFAAGALVERFDIEPFPDFSAK